MRSLHPAFSWASIATSIAIAASLISTHGDAVTVLGGPKWGPVIVAAAGLVTTALAAFARPAQGGKG